MTSDDIFYCIKQERKKYKTCGFEEGKKAKSEEVKRSMGLPLTQ